MSNMRPTEQFPAAQINFVKATKLRLLLKLSFVVVSLSSLRLGLAALLCLRSSFLQPTTSDFGFNIDGFKP